MEFPNSIYEKRLSIYREFDVLNEDGAINEECQKLQLIAKQKKQQELS